MDNKWNNINKTKETLNSVGETIPLILTKQKKL
jgi:hypothetical protein